MPYSHLILCRPLLLLPSIFPSIMIFSNESALCIRWPKFWSFSFSISPSNEHQDWSPLGWTGYISLQSKGLSRVFQHHSSKASILQLSAFFIVQLSHLYMTTGKTIAFYLWGLYKCLQFYLLLKSKLWLKHIVQLVDVRRLSWVGMLQPAWNS